MKFKRKLSVMLIVTMITSLFAGTIAAAPGRSRNAGDLFSKDPVILVTQEGGQIAQSFKVASPANAASWSDAELEATPADAMHVEKDVDEGAIVITPKIVGDELPSKGTISLDNNGTKYQGNVSFKWNQFKNGHATVNKGETKTVAFIASASNATKYEVEPSNSLRVVNTADKAGITITPIPGTNATNATITMISNDVVVGICIVTIEESSEVVSSTFLKDKDGKVQVGTSVDLSLTDYGKSVMASPSNAGNVSVRSDKPDIAEATVNRTDKKITVTGKSEGVADISVTYKDETDTQKTDIFEITVIAGEVPPDPTVPTGDFFVDEGNLTVVTGSIEKIPVKKEILTALSEKTATIQSMNTAVAGISDRSSVDAYYVEGIKAGYTTIRIEYDEKWDERTVEVIDGKKETLFDISDKDKKVSLTAGEWLDIELTEKALELLEETEEGSVIRTNNEDIAMAYLTYNPDSGVTCVAVEGVSAGETTLTLKIGDAVDTCTVKVNRNYVKEMEAVLAQIDNVDANNALNNKEVIEGAIKSIQEITISMVNENPEALNSMEDAEILEILNDQMEIIAKLEVLLPIINPNIELPKPVVAQEVSDLIGAFECIGVGLSVDPKTTSKTTANLVVKAALPEVPDVTVSANAVALDITLNISGTEEQPLAPIKVTMGIPQGLKDKDALAVYHVHNGSKTKFTPYINGDTMSFYITKLSTFVIDEDNVETAKVMLKSAQGGHVSAYSENASGVRTYVPVGEMVSVPVGTELHFKEGHVSPYLFKNITAKTGDNTTTIGREQIYFETVTITDQTTITPLFESRSTNPDPDYTTGYNIVYGKRWFMPGDKIDDQLFVYDDDDNNVVATNFDFDESDEETRENIERIKTYFDLTPDGKLTSKATLPDEDFNFSIKCEINGKQYDSTVDDYYGYVDYLSGISVGFVYDWYMPTNNSNPRVLWSDNKRLTTPTKFGTFKGEFNKMKMYGGYTFAGWSDYNMNLVSDERLIDEPYQVYARFKKDGKFYDPSGSGSSVNPNPPSSGSSGGRSGGSSYNTYTMRGNWQMTELGWKFLQNGSAYAQNQWGYINGTYYYFGADGLMMTGWVLVDNNWYYMNPTAGSVQGAMMTGWVADPTYNAWFYLNASGAMQTGWQLLDGKWYYLNPNSDGRRGTKLTSQWVGDYYLDENGVWIENMKK